MYMCDVLLLYSKLALVALWKIVPDTQVLDLNDRTWKRWFLQLYKCVMILGNVWDIGSSQLVWSKDQ